MPKNVPAGPGLRGYRPGKGGAVALEPRPSPHTSFCVSVAVLELLLHLVRPIISNTVITVIRTCFVRKRLIFDSRELDAIDRAIRAHLLGIIATLEAHQRSRTKASY